MFEGQRVGGDVFGVQVKDPFDGGLPGFERLFGQAVDQVKIEIIETGLAGGCHGFDDVEKVMCAFEHMQFECVRRLNPITDAVDPDLAQLT